MTETHHPRPRVVFAGTPDFAVPSLHCLHEHGGVEICAVYTQPDRRAGRGRKTQASPVKRAAEAVGLSVRQPASLKDAAAIDGFSALAPDLLVVAAYGLILPGEVLKIPRLALNVHASLLPRWRGAAPIQRAIMAGDAKTGISMMRVVEALDAGPVLLQRECPIAGDETGGSLHDKLAELGAHCLTLAVDDFLAGTVAETPQDESRVTYAAKITAADRVLDWNESAAVLERRVRALNPSPVATATFGDTTVKVWEAVALAESGGEPPGSVVALGDRGIDIATGAGTLRLVRVQPPGRQPLDAAGFINGYRALLSA